MTGTQPTDSRQFGLCPSCNRPLSKDRSKQLTWVVNGLAAFFVLLALGFVWCARNPFAIQNALAPFVSVTPGEVVTVVAPDTLIAGGKKVTFKQFQSLRIGMNLQQVRQVLGTSGVCCTTGRVEGISTSLYQWQNRDGSNISVEFRADKLAFKANMGLKPRSVPK